MGGDIAYESLSDYGEFESIVSHVSPDSPTSGFKALVRLGGGAGVDHVIGGCGKSHLQGRLSGFKCEWLNL